MWQKEMKKAPKLCAVRLLWQWFGAALGGVSVLGLLRVFAPWLGFVVKINVATLTMASVLGVPGMVLLLVLRLYV